MTGMDLIQVSELLHCSYEDKLACLNFRVLMLDVLRQFPWDDDSNGFESIWETKLWMIFMISIISGLLHYYLHLLEINQCIGVLSELVSDKV